MLQHAEHEVNSLHLAWTFHLQLGVSKNTRGRGRSAMDHSCRMLLLHPATMTHLELGVSKNTMGGAMVAVWGE